MEQENVSHKQRQRKGCLLIVGLFILMVVGITMAYKFDLLYLHYLSLISGSCIVGLVSGTYLDDKGKPLSKWQWIMYIALALVLAAVATWLTYLFDK